MAKTFVQDIVPGGRRSIRNIPLPNSKSESAGTRERVKKADDEQPLERSRKEKKASGRKTNHGLSRTWVWFGSFVALIIVVYVASFLFVSATVLVTSKEATLPIQITGTAAFEQADAPLSYTIVTLSREGGKEVQASGDVKVDNKASGKIVVYNNYSSAPQVLIAKTRFESSAGLIFRIQDQVTVPGQKVVGGVTVPGSVAATIYADVGGDKYNIGLSDFTIPGFKGDPRYAKFSAKSDPAFPVGGGFIGTVKKVTATDSASAKVSIETKLKTDLLDALSSQIPNSHVLFKNASTFSFQELPQAPGSGPATATIKEKGSVYGILFSKEQLYKFLANKVIDDTNKNVHLDDLEALNFTLDNVAGFNPQTPKQISFALAGNATFVWNVDESKISQSLAGQKRSNIEAVLDDFDSVEKATVAIKPIWILSLPNNPEKIKVQLQ